MLFTDTDSLIYKIKSERVYEEFFKHKRFFDLKNYAKDPNYFDPVNEKVIRKIKEVPDKKINDDFVGLKSKMYSIKNCAGEEPHTATGVNIATEFLKSKTKQKGFRSKLKRIQRLHNIIIMF